MGMLLLVALCVNLFVFAQINSMVRRIDSVFSSNVTIGELSDTLDLVEDRVYEYLSTKSSAALEDYYRYEQDYRELLQELNLTLNRTRQAKITTEISEIVGGANALRNGE